MSTSYAELMKVAVIGLWASHHRVVANESASCQQVSWYDVAAH